MMIPDGEIFNSRRNEMFYFKRVTVPRAKKFCDLVIETRLNSDTRLSNRLVSFVITFF